MSTYPFISETYGVFLTPEGGQILKYKNINGIHRVVKTCEKLNMSACAILEHCTGCNTITNIIDYIEKKFEDTPPTFVEEVENFLNDAAQKGYITYSNTPELKGIIKGSIDYYIPSSVLFEITTKCNLKCIHCLLAAGAPLEDELSAPQIISVLERLYELGVSTIELSGGELLTKEKWEKIFDFCKNRFTLSILTNGTLITEEIADILQHSSTISISLYGADAKTHDRVTGVEGSFSQVLKGTTLLTERGIDIRAAIMLFPFTLNNLEDIIKVAISIGCNKIQVGMVCSVGRAEKKQWNLSQKKRKWLDKKMNELKKKYKTVEIRWEEESIEKKEKKEHKCGAGFTRWEITSNGDVYPCTTIRIPMGNVIKEDPIQICTSEMVTFFQTLITPHRALCGECEYLYLCNNCHAQALTHFYKVDYCAWSHQFENAPDPLKHIIEEKRKNRKEKMEKNRKKNKS